MTKVPESARVCPSNAKWCREKTQKLMITAMAFVHPEVNQ